MKELFDCMKDVINWIKGVADGIENVVDALYPIEAVTGAGSSNNLHNFGSERW
jgi:hypothetical protein